MTFTFGFYSLHDFGVQSLTFRRVPKSAKFHCLKAYAWRLRDFITTSNWAYKCDWMRKKSPGEVGKDTLTPRAQYS